MSQTTNVSLRCPADVIAAVQAIREKTGASQTTVMLDALRVGLGLADADRPGRTLDALRSLDELHARLSDLEATVRQHEQLVDGAEKMRQRIRVLEDRMRFKAPSVPPNGTNEPHARATEAPPGAPPEDKQPHALPLTAVPAEPATGYLTRRQAFEALGGNLADKTSRVPTLDGSKRLLWNTFRLHPQTKYEPFGFEVDEARRAAGHEDFLRATPRQPTTPMLFPIE